LKIKFLLFCSSLTFSSKTGVNFNNVLHAAFLHQKVYVNLMCKGYSIKVECIDKVGNGFIGETEWHQRMITGALAICAIRMVKSTPGLNFINVLRAAFAPTVLHQ
jgi:hypothetical protein